VEVSGLRFRYGAAPIFGGLDLRLHRGEFAVLAGANGSGKSTLLRLLVGLLRPESGTIRVLGGSPTDPAIQRGIGYAPQGLRTVTTLPVSVREVVGAGVVPSKPVLGRMHRSDWLRVDTAIDAVGLGDLAGECLFELSGGQQQRAILARALVGDPELLLLDEPTTGIDPAARPTVVREFRRRADAGATVVAVSHDPDEFHEVCEQILVLEEGRLEPISHDEFHHRYHRHAERT
jgi:zinc transport system ATP-binding protein